MLHQETRDNHCVAEDSPTQGMLVPRDLAERTILNQSLQPDGSIEVHVRATTDREACPPWKRGGVTIHETRGRGKRERALRGYPGRLVLLKRRFRCIACRRTFPETDRVCGREKRTPRRCRDQRATQACRQPMAHVAEHAHGGPRVVHDCVATVREEPCAKQGRSVDETARLPTPCFLGSDACARRTGHHNDPILCDLVTRTVLDISESRTLEEVHKR